jgi:endonuclease/exonuclease/phosphatase (EEP) superfamily protein YafD
LISAEIVIEARTVRLMNTHLQAFFMIGSSSAEHPAQRDAIEAELRKQQGAAVLAGDFNCAPGEGLVEQLDGAGFRAVQNKTPTWRRMPYAMDHLFYNAPLKLVSHAVIPTLASDHHAVLAEFSFV